MPSLKKTKSIKHNLFFTALFFWGCCHYGYTTITLSNLSGKDKYFKAYASIKDSKHNIGWKELDHINSNEQTELIISRHDSDGLKEFKEEKRIVVIFFNSMKDKTAAIEKDSINKKV
ncbi:MAG TPA: hypothetical protein VFR70_07020, partial [Flavobacterium sp.]|nr:hypothetical protein [Flavobacterium sp.]